MDNLAITPEDADKAREKSIPPEVFEAFNELIVADLDAYGTATVRQCDVEKAIRAKIGTIEMRWLDVESSYRAAGWRVEYDKPAYNETYEPTFKFNRKSRQAAKESE